MVRTKELDMFEDCPNKQSPMWKAIMMTIGLYGLALGQVEPYKTSL